MRAQIWISVLVGLTLLGCALREMQSVPGRVVARLGSGEFSRLTVSEDVGTVFAGLSFGDGRILRVDSDKGASVEVGRHGERITCLTSSSDGRFVLALGVDDRWTLWDAVSKKLVREWQGDAFIDNAAFSRSGDRFAEYSEGEAILIRSVGDPKSSRRLQCPLPVGGGLVWAGQDSTIVAAGTGCMAWDVESGRVRWAHKESEPISSLGTDREHKRLLYAANRYSAQRSNLTRLDAKTGRVIGTTETDLLITQVLFLADREALVVASSWSDWENQRIVKVVLATGRYSSILRFSGHSIAATYVDREGALYCGLNRSVTKIAVNWTTGP